MEVVLPGVANTVGHNLISATTGRAIDSGATVTFYLLARNGANAGKFFRALDNTWQAAESSAGDGVHKAGALWLCTIPAAAWQHGVEYELYARDSQNREVEYTTPVVVSLATGVIGAGDIAWDYTLTDSVTGLPIPSATIWVTTDSAGTQIVAKGTTDAAGKVIFHLTAGTYYIWCQKAGYAFANPDTETVI